MDVTLSIPDDIAGELMAGGGDLRRRVLENFALEELRAGRITEVQLRKMLGMERLELDGFLKAHGIYADITLADIERDVADLKAALGPSR
ncbi:MAG: UPF0175 family protein [Acidobacteria bacterium]|nr:UPF0175 family protein [Acidobacteriota bacterium]